MARINANFGAAVLFWAMAASGQTCPETAVASNEQLLSPEWRVSLHDLVKATSKPGFPWSCTGARLSLTQDADGTGAILRIEDRHERSAERHVRSPADLVPTGEALLASTERIESEPLDVEVERHEGFGAQVQPSAAKSSPEIRGETSKSTRKKPPTANQLPNSEKSLFPEPRVLVGVFATGRYSGPLNTLWSGFALRGSIPFGDWSVALSGRFNFPAWIFDQVPIDFSMSEMSIQFGIGRRLIRRPFELHTVLDFSMHVVTMEGGDEPNLAEASGADPRVGLDIRTVWPLKGRWRFVVALDGELAPLAFVGSDDRKVDDALPPLPSHTIGLSLGLELGFK